jgi:hypothetical protein
MKYAAMLLLLVVSTAAVAAQDCKPLYEAPAVVSVSARDGGNNITANAMAVKGNKLSPLQPSEKLNFVVGSFDFAITPVSSCADGLQIRLEAAGTIKETVVAWGKKVVVSGNGNSSHYIEVTALRAKP